MKRFHSTSLRDWLTVARTDRSPAAHRRRRLARAAAESSRRRVPQRQSQLERLETRHLLAALTGEVFFDLNQDALRQAGEAAAADVRVYLDQNANGRWDPNELSTTTDAEGVYGFAQLPAGDYEVRVAPAAGYVQTLPALTFGWNDTVVQDEKGEYFRVAQLFQVDERGKIESIGQPTRSRMDGLVRIGDDSLIGIDTRSNEVFRVDSSTGERSRIAETQLDLAGGLAYDRVGNSVYTLVRSSSDATNHSLARLDPNTGRVSQIGVGMSGLKTVTDLVFDPVNRRVIGFDNKDDEFFAFDLNGIGRTLARSNSTTIDPTTGVEVSTGLIDADSMALATAEQLAGFLPNDPVVTSTYVWMFDAKDPNRTATLLVEIPDEIPNVIETAVVRSSLRVSEPVRPVALTRSAVGNNARKVTLSDFESRSGVNFAIAPDVIGFRLLPSRPDSGASMLGQARATVVGGAIADDFVEVSLNRQPMSEVTLRLNLSSNSGGATGAILETKLLTFAPEDWDTPRRVRITPDLESPVSVISASTLTATIEIAHSDLLWRTLPAQTLPVRVLPPLNPNRFSNPVINEILLEGRFNSDVNATSDQYIELRGKPHQVLPAGTYLVVIEEATSQAGEISTVIDLSGQSFGASGFLVLLQGASPHPIAFGANVLQSNTPGFSGLPGGIFSSSRTDGSLESLLSNASYFLLQSEIPPVVGMDIDPDNNGFIDPASSAANWEVYDAVAMHDFGRYDLSYAPIVFVDSLSKIHPSVERTSRGQTLVTSNGFGYAGRIGDSIGSDYDDWVFGTVHGVAAGFWGGESDPAGLLELFEDEISYPALMDRALDHVGQSNFVGGVRGKITLLPSHADILAGADADARLSAEGVTVFVDTNANGRRDDLVFIVEPDDAAPASDRNAPVPSDAEYPLTQFFDGVTITWSQGSSRQLTDDIVSRRQQDGFDVLENRVFSAGPFDTFHDSRRLRFDFFHPIRSASIDVINASANGLVYGRLDAFNANGELVATSLSAAVAQDRRGTVTVSAPGEQIVRIEAYGDDNFSANSYQTSLDAFQYVQSEPAAVTDENGIYVISGLFPGDYEPAILGTVNGSHLLEASTLEPFTVSRFENYFFETQYRPNTPPTLPSGAELHFELDENPPVGSVIAIVDAFDADGGPLVYEFAGGDTAGLELVVQSDFTAELRVTEGANLDYETDPRRVLLVRATDEFGASVTARVILQLRDVNEPPVVSNTVFRVSEDAMIGTVIGRIDAVDPDAGSSQLLTYRVIPSTPDDFFADDASSFFAVDRANGMMTLTAALDYETLSTMRLRVEVDDHQSTEEETSGIAIVDLIIHVSDENDRPQIVQNLYLVPESATGELFALEVFDPDYGQSHVFQLIDAHPSIRLTADGRVFLAAGAKLDYETQPHIQFRVSVRDDGRPPLASIETITLQVEDVNEPPEFDPAVVASTFSGGRITSGTVFRLNVPENIATDPEHDAFSLFIGQKVRNAQGDLVVDEFGRAELKSPTWLSYDETTRELVGQPGPSIRGQVDLVIRASENGAASLSSDAEFSFTVTPQTNTANRFDVNNDGVVTALDALRIINFAFPGDGDLALAGSLSETPVYLDVSGDGKVTQVDALQVINELNRLADLNLTKPVSPAPEPLPHSQPKSVAVPAPDRLGSDEDQRNREDTIDAILSELDLF